MKRLRIAGLLLVIVFPFTSFAKQGLGWHWLNQKADERRQERLEQRQQENSGDYYRLGREVLNNTGSPRRRRITQTATVSGVVDGSILIIQQADGSHAEIRLLGVDAPAFVSRRLTTAGRPQELYGGCYAQEAREALRDLLIGEQVTIERPETYQRDSYRRLVRYIRLGSQDVNAWMIWHGYAFSDDNHDHERLNEYEALELRAKEAERGIWSFRCDYNENPDDVIEVLE